jgi:hypothetical protein
MDDFTRPPILEYLRDRPTYRGTVDEPFFLTTAGLPFSEHSWSSMAQRLRKRIAARASRSASIASARRPSPTSTRPAGPTRRSSRSTAGTARTPVAGCECSAGTAARSPSRSSQSTRRSSAASSATPPDRKPPPRTDHPTESKPLSPTHRLVAGSSKTRCTESAKPSSRVRFPPSPQKPANSVMVDS